MKKKIMTLILGILAPAMNAFGQQPTAWTKSTPEQKEQLAWAVRMLVQSGALKSDENQCAQFDGDLIKELRDKGLLGTGNSEVSVVCIGGGTSTAPQADK